MKYFAFLFLYLLCISLPTSAQDPSDTTIYTVVEEMPFLKSCEDRSETYQAKKKCSDQKLLSYLYNNIKLDSIDVYYSNCCNSIFSFVINKEGKVQDIKIIKSLNESFDARMMKIIENFPEWVPGRQRGKNMSVRMNLPIKIKPGPQW